MSAPNPFDQFDAAPAQSQGASAANVFDQFDGQGVSQTNPTAPAKSALPAVQKPSIGNKILQGIMAPIGAFDQLATGAIAQPISGLAGLADIPLHALGITDTSPADTITNVQNALTYRPNNPYAQQMMRDISYLPGKVASAADYAGGKLSNALGGGIFGNVSGAGLSTAIQALPMLLGAKIPESSVSDVVSVPKLTTPAATARSLGYKLAPSEAGSSLPTRFVEGLVNSPRLKGRFSILNQRVTNSLVGKDLESMGLKSGEPITPNTLESLRAPQNAIYEKISSLGKMPTDTQLQTDLANIGNTPGTSFPLAKNADVQGLRDAYSVPEFDAADAIQHIKQLRKLGHSNIKAAAANISQNAPMMGELGHAQLETATALENQIERNLKRGPTPDLVQGFKQARQNLAKIHSVENAMIGDTGNISAQALAKQMQRGVPLSGNMAKVAKVAKDFPHVTQDLEKVANNQPVGALRGMFGGGEILGGIASGHPGLGLATAGATLAAPPLVRNLFGSPFIQNRLPDVLSGTLKGTAPALTKRQLGLLSGAAASGLLNLQKPNY